MRHPIAVAALALSVVLLGATPEVTKTGPKPKPYHGCVKSYSQSQFHAAARKVYVRGDWKITRRESKQIRKFIYCQRSARSERKVQKHLRRYKASHTRRWYWHVEWAKISPALKTRLARVRACESGHNYRATNGQYTGAYQYADSTWARAGGRGRAMDASPREQDVRTAWFFPSHVSEWACKG